MTQPVLPRELNSAIVGSCSADLLPIVALVSKELQAHAEMRLYDSLTLHTFNKKLGSLEALVMRPERAAYVTFLSIEFDSATDGFDEIAMKMFFRCAPALRQLRELRVRSQASFRKMPEFIDNMNTIICEYATLRLTTLFIDDCVDIPAIIASLPKLDLLGLFCSNGLAGPLGLLFNSPDRPIMIVGLGTGVGFCRHYESIVFFPDFLSERHGREFEASLIRAFTKYDEGSVRLNLKDITFASILLQDIPSQPIFRSFVSSVAQVFPCISELEFHLQKCDKILEEESRIDAEAFPSLKTVTFQRYEMGNPKVSRLELDWPQSREDMGSYAREWERRCPRLKSMFFGGGWLADTQSSWEVEHLEGEEEDTLL
ncbi:hypothetical protein FA13DRAFT_1739656 [Coprinellus micaceus]|uniref:F-box domain-containing protein n=1 Tax=Coprinellus micaceus TaxID=71717 RepID=A0A4Y7SPS7_COPMI|nr:hypothetical protein FA13DRAFT_1739656 [Coprinellus micaceus]